MQGEVGHIAARPCQKNGPIPLPFTKGVLFLFVTQHAEPTALRPRSITVKCLAQERKCHEWDSKQLPDSGRTSALDLSAKTLHSSNILVLNIHELGGFKLGLSFTG